MKRLIKKYINVLHGERWVEFDYKTFHIAQILTGCINMSSNVFIWVTCDLSEVVWWLYSFILI